MYLLSLSLIRIIIMDLIFQILYTLLQISLKVFKFFLYTIGCTMQRTFVVKNMCLIKSEGRERFASFVWEFGLKLSLEGCGTREIISVFNVELSQIQEKVWIHTVISISHWPTFGPSYPQLVEALCLGLGSYALHTTPTPIPTTRTVSGSLTSQRAMWSSSTSFHLMLKEALAVLTLLR